MCRRSRRQLAALNKECQFGFSAEATEEPADLDPTMAYYQLDDGGDAVFTPLSVRKRTVAKLRSVAGPRSNQSFISWLLPQGPAGPPPPTIRAPPPTSSSSYRVRSSPGTLPPAPAHGNTPGCSSEEDQEDTSTVEDQGERSFSQVEKKMQRLSFSSSRPQRRSSCSTYAGGDHVQ